MNFFLAPALGKGFNLYFEDKDNTFFSVDLTSVEKEKNTIAILKQLGQIKISAEKITHLKKALPGYILNSIGGLLGAVLALASPGIALTFLVFVFAGIPGLLLELALLLGIGVGGFGLGTLGQVLYHIITERKVPIVTLSQLSDGIAKTLETDLPKLRLLQIDPDKIDLNGLAQGADLSKLTLGLKGNPKGSMLNTLLTKTNIKQLDLASLELSNDGLENLGRDVADKLLERLELSVAAELPKVVDPNKVGLDSDKVNVLIKGLGNGKLQANSLSLENAFKGEKRIEVMERLLPKIEANILNLAYNPLEINDLDKLATTLKGKKLEYLSLVGTLKETDRTQLIQKLQTFLSQVDIGTLDLRKNGFSKTSKKLIKQIADTLKKKVEV